MDVISGPHIGEHRTVFKHPLDRRLHAVWLHTPDGDRRTLTQLARWMSKVLPSKGEQHRTGIMRSQLPDTHDGGAYRSGPC